ncbi:MAG: RNA polymerase sigma factor [Planctomycetales bacterium]
MQDGGDELAEHLPRMYRCALRILGDADRAEEIVQEASLRALRRMNGFHGRSSLATWLHRVTVNCSLDLLRREGRQRNDPLDESAGLLSRLEAAPPTAVERRELYDIARALVDRLPDDCRRAFILTQLDGYSYDETVDIENEPRGTIASRVYRAKRLLLAAMNDGSGQDGSPGENP